MIRPRPTAHKRKIKKYKDLGNKNKNTALATEEREKLQKHISYLDFATKYAIKKFEVYDSSSDVSLSETTDANRPKYVFSDEGAIISL